MAEAIRVNFGRPMPVFPLPDAVLLPHAIQPLHVGEPRYKKMIGDCLDGTGQFAVASFAGEDWKSAGGAPSLRPAVCVGQIIQHELDDGQYDVLVQGICRAKILKMFEPDNGRPYRLAQLVPLENFKGQPPQMSGIRSQLRKLLTNPRLRRFRAVKQIAQWFDRDDISTHALLELIGFALVAGVEQRYRLLAESSALRRAGLIKQELISLDTMIRQADRQPFRDWPRGMSWN